MNDDDRLDNLLGAFVLAVADRLRIDTEEAVGHTGAAAAALVMIASTGSSSSASSGDGVPAGDRPSPSARPPPVAGRRARSSTCGAMSWPTRCPS